MIKGQSEPHIEPILWKPLPLYESSSEAWRGEKNFR